MPHLKYFYDRKLAMIKPLAIQDIQHSYTGHNHNIKKHTASIVNEITNGMRMG